MVKKIFLCLFACLVMNSFAMKTVLSDSEEETVDRTPKNVTILVGKTLEKTFVLTKEDIARKYSFLNACSMASRSESPRIQLPPDISFAALDTALQLTRSFRKAWGHNQILLPAQLQVHIKPEMIAPVLHVLLHLGARTDLIVAIGLLARESIYKRSLQESLAQSPAFQKELFEKTGTALTICYSPFLKKPESMPKNSIDRLAILTDIWQRNNFFLKRTSVPVATQTDAPEERRVCDYQSQTDLISGPVLAAIETQAGVGEVVLKSGEAQTEVVGVDASAATEIVEFVDKVGQVGVGDMVLKPGEAQTEASMSKMVSAQTGTVELASSSAATETVSLADNGTQASTLTDFGEAQTEASMSKMVSAQTGTVELASSSAATETVSLADNGIQASVLTGFDEAQTEAPVGADASAATEPVEFVDKVSQAECPSAAACAQTERRALVLSEPVMTCNIAPTKRKSFEMSDVVTVCDIAPRELKDQAANKPITKNIWQRTANLGIGEAVTINKKLDKKSNPVYIMAQAIAKKKKPVEVVASEVQTEDVTHVASPIPASLLFVPDRASTLSASRKKCVRGKKPVDDQRVIFAPVPAVNFPPCTDYTRKPTRTSQPLLWPAWFAQFFSRWLPTPTKPISSDEHMCLPVVPSDKINVDAVLRPAKFLLLAAELS